MTPFETAADALDECLDRITEERWPKGATETEGLRRIVELSDDIANHRKEIGEALDVGEDGE